MIHLFTAEEMRALERDAIESWGVPSLVLQEHAALGALDLVPRGHPIHVLAGPGNNGGDALALARLARLRGEQVQVWTLDPSPRWRGDAAHQARLWEGLGGDYLPASELPDAAWRSRGWLVDGLFGLGARPPLREGAAACVRALSAPSRPFQVLALDLPSGLDPSAPDFPDPALRADVTACFGHLKVCHALEPARSYCGRVVVVPIPLRGDPGTALALVDGGPPLKRGPREAHKRQFGHVGIRAGTPGMGGAAVMGALGALRMGAGLVTVLTDPQVRAEIAAQVPEAMVRAWDGVVPPGIDVLVAGPGGVEEVPAWEGPLVLDASALGRGDAARWLQRPRTVLTPHAGEFARLLDRPPLTSASADRLDALRSLPDTRAVIVLKGAQTLVSGGGDGRILVNPTGHPGLASGGTGDLLAGMLGARLGMLPPETAPDRLKEAVAQTVWLHGAAADRLGPGPLLVRDLCDSLAVLLRDSPPAP